MKQMLIIIIIILSLLILFIFRKLNIETFTQSKIPKHLYLCYKTKNIDKEILDKWKILNPKYTIHFFDDDDCENFLKNNYHKYFINIFRHLKDGPIKSDFWRICILNIYGGVYCDIDIEPLVPFSEYFDDSATFITTLSCHKGNINPHITASTPNNIILKKCINEYMFKFLTPYSYWNFSIVFIMSDIIKKTYGKLPLKSGVYKYENNNVQYLLEKKELNYFNWNTMYNNIKVLNNRYKNYVNHKFKN